MKCGCSLTSCPGHHSVCMQFNVMPRTHSLETFSLILDLFLVSLNTGLFTNPLHYAAIADLADNRNIDVFALTETCISTNTTSAQLFDAIPHGFTARLFPDSCTSSIVGGGTAFLLYEPCKLLPHLLLLSNPLKCLLSRSNFLTLIWLCITSIVLLNIAIYYKISTFFVFLSVFRRLSDSHLICIKFPRISYHQ